MFKKSLQVLVLFADFITDGLKNYCTVQNICGTKLLRFSQFTPYLQMFFQELSVEQYNPIEVMVTTAKFFSANATYLGDVTVNILSLKCFVL